MGRVYLPQGWSCLPQMNNSETMGLSHQAQAIVPGQRHRSFGEVTTSNLKKDAAGEWEPASTAIIAFQFGLAITVLAYATAHSSGVYSNPLCPTPPLQHHTSCTYINCHTAGGHINCAVTWALCLVGKCHPVQGAAHFVAQMFGSVVGAVLLRLSIGDGKMDRTGGIGSNGLQGDYVGIGNAFIAETMGTISPGR